mgnify:CR=1 FL=1
MTSLQVLCPNGRRQNVKITPNTKLLQVSTTIDRDHGKQLFRLYSIRISCVSDNFVLSNANTCTHTSK